jgi:opacity protein-like surface antigen
MNRIPLTILLLLFFVVSSAQGVQIGVFAGVSSYNGDLTDKIFPKQTRNAVLGITGTYEITDHISARAGFTYTMLGAADRFNEDPELQSRNLSFETRLYEFSLQGQYDLFSMNEKRFTPYLMAGVAAFHFNPYVFYSGKEKVYLQPLGTEGQGIDGYGEKYNRLQFAIPVGGGIKYALTDRITLGLEAHVRKTFTDYIDDVSTDYADMNDLMNAYGQTAVDVSYRGDELPNGSSIYPSRGIQRGSPKAKDIYYFAGLHLTWKFGGNGGFAGGRGGKFGCPPSTN